MSVAQIMAKRSLCERDQVGAVVVSDTNRVVATGYNGPPRGFNAEPHVNMRQTSCSSWCSRAQQVCVCGHHQSNHTGAHESPTACGSCGCWGYDGLPKSYDNCPSLHAEANALMVCDYRDRENGTIYVTSSICINCAKLIANSGLQRVFVLVDPVQTSHRDFTASHDFIKRCGLYVNEMEVRREAV